MATDGIRPVGAPSAMQGAAAAALAAQTPPTAKPSHPKGAALGRDSLIVSSVVAANVAHAYVNSRSGQAEATSMLFPNPAAASQQLGAEMRQLGANFSPPVVVDSASFVDDASTTIHLNRLKFSPVFRAVGQRSMADQSFMHLIRHESGHAAYNEAMTPAKQPRFTTIFGSYDRPYKVGIVDQVFANFKYEDSPHFVSRYAQAHPAEDFAETYGVYVKLGGNRQAIADYVAGKGGSEALASKFDFVAGLVKDLAKMHPA